MREYLQRIPDVELKATEVAKTLGVSEKTVWNYRRSRGLKTIDRVGPARVSSRDLAAWIYAAAARRLERLENVASLKKILNPNEYRSSERKSAMLSNEQRETVLNLIAIKLGRATERTDCELSNAIVSACRFLDAMEQLTDDDVCALLADALKRWGALPFAPKPSASEAARACVERRSENLVDALRRRFPGAKVEDEGDGIVHIEGEADELDARAVRAAADELCPASPVVDATNFVATNAETSRE